MQNGGQVLACPPSANIQLYGSSILHPKGKQWFYIFKYASRKPGIWAAKNPDKIGVFAEHIFFMFLLWRSGWDSNPRNLAVQLISSQSRYDHFDTAPYLSQHQHLGKRGELMGRTSKNIKLRIPEKPRKIKGFRSGSYRVATTISSQSRYDHFDTSPYLGESFRITVLL